MCTNITEGCPTVKHLKHSYQSTPRSWGENLVNSLPISFKLGSIHSLHIWNVGHRKCFNIPPDIRSDLEGDDTDTIVSYQLKIRIGRIMAPQWYDTIVSYQLGTTFHELASTYCVYMLRPLIVCNILYINSK
jgi:hypothetical protein